MFLASFYVRQTTYRYMVNSVNSVKNAHRTQMRFKE